MGEANTFADDKDQVMLFARPSPFLSSFPGYLLELHDSVKSLLEPRLPPNDFKAAFEQPLARQAILNLYPPGQGITPHIDLPNRYADGIIGISLTGGCTMVFQSSNTEARYDVYLPERSVYVMTGEARWEWKHGIEGRLEDLIRGGEGSQVETKLRSTRASVTFRWMQEGAEVLI
jgi:alkylated DNA repair dioxygenase AlkB